MDLNLDLGYKKNVLYENVHVSIPNNGVISFIGDNGSGKSTLYKTILGVIPPLNGTVPSDIKNKVAIVSDYVNMPSEVSVQNLLHLIGEKNVKFAEKHYQSLHKYITGILNSKINKLSSGQRRIVEIYMTLASGKTIIILDEAGNSLDFKNRKLFLEQVKALSEQNILFLHTSHELDDVAYLEGEIYGLFKDDKAINPYNGEYKAEKLRQFLRCEVL